MIRTLRTIRYIVNDVQWTSIYESPWWFLTIHLPYVALCLVQALYRPGYKNLYFNSKIYDGLSRNGFKKGNMIQLLHRLRAIKKPESPRKDIDGRGYFIGYQNDED